jgi:hypothetical protein
VLDWLPAEQQHQRDDEDADADGDDDAPHDGLGVQSSDG